MRSINLVIFAVIFAGIVGVAISSKGIIDDTAEKLGLKDTPDPDNNNYKTDKNKLSYSQAVYKSKGLLIKNILLGTNIPAVVNLLPLGFVAYLGQDWLPNVQKAKRNAILKTMFEGSEPLKTRDDVLETLKNISVDYTVFKRNFFEEVKARMAKGVYDDIQNKLKDFEIYF